MPDGSNIIGRGIYPVPVAARLLHMPAARVRAWVYGNGSEAVLTPELATEDGQEALSFINLVEILFLAELRGQGVSLQSIRTMLDRAKRMLGTEHPFAVRRFHTDGKAIWLETAEATGDRRLVDLTDGNGAMLQVLERSFRKSVSFDDTTAGIANLWRPSADQPRIVLDPARRFGRPIDSQTGMPTEILANALRAEGGNVARVAALWEVPPEAVEQAAEFEMRISKRLAA
ncbi:MerR family transcriptional regulator [Gluconacetobacter sp. 1b LMG 1731]|uniref:MerR family transcriptional regulator n=1 Tax=Gluconacetobacter dulcium TaxID=2729096 RepID=A0A7W4IM47_9PROT|nr:MerR family transcriptional regulator [Gluconacetobacter dulcium]MBB2165393.1 MerR family transcriptional regulator [Gluconacetobacter dulcium]MBB2194440.1 MerR family transcriptional regulator [Gluconacetobacter dulcium]